MVFRPKLLIIDLDNTLCDTFHTLSKPQWQRVAKALGKRGRKKEAKLLLNNLGNFGFSYTIKTIGLSKSDIDYAVRIYDQVDIKGLTLYKDAPAILNIDIPKVLVTRGERKLQIKKIRKLKLRKYFDGIYYIHTFQTKKDAFKEILKKFRMKPKDALVVGDRVEEEIKDANELGIPCVLVLRPNWEVHRNIAKPDLTVRSLYTLAKRIKR